MHLRHSGAALQGCERRAEALRHNDGYSTMTTVHVIRPGMLTTVQDRGRWGLQSRGVPVAGPMDPFSHRLANALVRNDPAAATLEVTLLGPELEFRDERIVAVSGAAFEVSVDGRIAPAEAPFVVAAGSH